MINKIKIINNLAVFNDFNWDDEVKDEDGNVCEFKNINILYGRNYSGKTTLSRIFRAMETDELSDKYSNPAFSVLFDNETEITQDNLIEHDKKIRVFNEDFVRDNLKFISNPDESINSFAILGSENNILEAEINSLKDVVGSDEEGEETGLYEYKVKNKEKLDQAKAAHTEAQNNLDDQLRKKALDRNIGIKYNPDKYGDQNYTVTKLSADIKSVGRESYHLLSHEEQEKLVALINEKPNDTIPTLNNATLKYDQLSEKTKLLLEKKIGGSNKIDELVKSAILNRWVNEGRKLHKDQRDTCAFCNNKIQESRWSELEKHFDLESEKLENDIDTLIDSIKKEQDGIKIDFNPNKTAYYSKFHSRLDVLSEKHSIASEEYCSKLDALLIQLQNRLGNLIDTIPFQKSFQEETITSVWNELDIIRTESNEYTDSLVAEQTKARVQLRLQEVSNFIETIQYKEQLDSIGKLKIGYEDASKIFTELNDKIQLQEQEIDTKKALLKDESKGADKVNEYLNDFFGHNFLSLEAVEFQDDESTEKKFKFEVTRNGEKAFHLSEGECSLVAFCYFMGKLSDIDTKDTKPIIWIDDPISSLDGNHIFFIYSLIYAEIVNSENFEQLFISTHNLDFLKYLKRLPGAHNDENKRENRKKYRHLIVLRNAQKSSVLLMPDYLRKYITEFNYLFHHIYNCSTIDVIDDSNHDVFYNFGNNARKFLEMYLYYKYPDDAKHFDKMAKFFGDEIVPAVLIDRVNNEQSHLSGCMERGSEPIEIPEMKSAASLILNRIELLDEEQYKSLLRSIDELQE